MNNILVATKLAYENDSVFIRALQCAARSRAKLHILHVLTHTTYASDADIRAFPHLDSHEQHIHDKIKNLHGGEQISYEVHITNGGRIYEQIDLWARKVSADLVIIGRSDRGLETPGSLATTSERVAVETNRPLLIVWQEATRPYHLAMVHMDVYNTGAAGLRILANIAPDASVTLLGDKDTYLPRRYNPQHWRLQRLLKNKKASFKSPPTFNGISDMRPEAFLNLAQAEKVDLIAVRTSAHDALPHLPNDIMKIFLTDTPCDVLIVGRE